MLKGVFHYFLIGIITLSVFSCKKESTSNPIVQPNYKFYAKVNNSEWATNTTGSSTQYKYISDCYFDANLNTIYFKVINPTDNTSIEFSILNVDKNNPIKTYSLFSTGLGNANAKYKTSSTDSPSASIAGTISVTSLSLDANSDISSFSATFSGTQNSTHTGSSGSLSTSITDGKITNVGKVN